VVPIKYSAGRTAFIFHYKSKRTPNKDAFKPGIVFGVLGIILGLITLIIWRKMEHKAPIKLNGRMVTRAVFGIIGALTLGVGMCFCMVWENIVLGTFIGLAGILLLLALIPITKGIK